MYFKGYLSRKTKQHIQTILDTLRRYDEMLSKSKFNGNPKNAELILIIERFILTHLTSLKDRRGYSLREARQQFSLIRKLNIKQIVLVIPEEFLKERVMSTVNHRNDEWREYLYSHGSEDQIIKRFREWQDRLIKYANSFSNLIETVTIKVNHPDYKKYAEQILDKYLKD